MERMSCNQCTPEKCCQRHLFPFLELPTELRVAIYQKMLRRSEPINLSKKLPVVIQRAPRGQELVMRRRGANSSSDSDTFEGRDINRERNKRVPRAAKDPLSPHILLLCKQTHHEALPILYRDNAFNLHLEFSLLPLTWLRQRTRSLIRHVTINIHEHSDVLNGSFNDLFTNGLRYCFGLEVLEIVTKVPMPRDRGYELNLYVTQMPATYIKDLLDSLTPSHILRWLPKACKVEVKGEFVSERVKKMVEEQNMLAQKLDLHTYHRRQIQTYYMERGQQVEHFVEGAGLTAGSDT